MGNMPTTSEAIAKHKTSKSGDIVSPCCWLGCEARPGGSQVPGRADTHREGGPACAGRTVVRRYRSSGSSQGRTRPRPSSWSNT